MESYHGKKNGRKKVNTRRDGRRDEPYVGKTSMREMTVNRNLFAPH